MQTITNVMKAGISLVLALIIGGCVSSLQPFYTEKDLIIDPALIGEWLYKEGELKFTFTQDKGMTYALMVEGPDSLKYYSVHLMRLKDSYFLDIYPKRVPITKKDVFTNGCYIPAHIIATFRIKEDSLFIGQLDSMVLESLLKDRKINLRHEYYETKILLTGSTEELQNFLLTYKDEGDLFSLHYELKKTVQGTRPEKSHR